MSARRRVILALIAALAWLLFWPLPSSRGVTPRPPALTHVEALARYEAFRATRDTGLAPECATELLDHGAPTTRAVVLLHGLSNCPRQFDSLAHVLYAGGDNVLVPRFPHHGLADRMTGDLVQLTSVELARTTAEAVAIAQGLGDTVIVAGLSMGGVATAWAAQNLPGVDRAVLISPALGPPVPPWMAATIARAAVRLPNRFIWWSPTLKEAVPGSLQTYPRFPSHAIANAYWLGHEVLEAAARAKPHTLAMGVVSSASDLGISHEMTNMLVERWRAHGAVIESFQYSKEDSVQHDMVDPSQPDQRVAKVYPLLVRMIDGVSPHSNP
jgi:carboxylesterase